MGPDAPWPQARVEPSADHRRVAQAMFQMYSALCQEGFTAEQAMQMVTAVMIASLTGGSQES